MVVHLDGVNDALIVRGVAERIQLDPEFRASPRSDDEAKYVGLRRLRARARPLGPGQCLADRPESVLAWRDMPTATRWRFNRRVGQIGAVRSGPAVVTYPTEAYQNFSSVRESDLIALGGSRRLEEDQPTQLVAPCPEGHTPAIVPGG